MAELDFGKKLIVSEPMILIIKLLLPFSNNKLCCTVSIVTKLFGSILFNILVKPIYLTDEVRFFLPSQ